MPINSIISAPATNSLHAAYRPIILTVRATRTDGDPVPPVVYCDIYFNDFYYKTLSKSVYNIKYEENTDWKFDIQDAAQEFLKVFPGIVDSKDVLNASPLIVKTFCRFRSSGYDTNGFLQYENIEPKQRTGTKPPLNGTGTQSTTFYVVNATLQHEDNQNLKTHLNAFKRKTWSENSFPLTHRPKLVEIGRDQSDFFPAIFSDEIKKLRLNYRFYGQNTFHKAEADLVVSACSALINNLSVSAGSSGHTLSWNLVSGSPVKYHVASDQINEGQPSETTQTSMTFSGLSTGSYTFSVTPYCTVNGIVVAGTPVVLQEEIVEIPPPVCSPVGIIPATLPDAVFGQLYEETIQLTGDLEFMIYDVVKPAWMVININVDVLTISGTPNLITASTPVQFTIKNCDGANSVSFSQNIAVEADAAGSGCSSIPAGLYAVLAQGAEIVETTNKYCPGDQNYVLENRKVPLTITFYQDAAHTISASISPLDLKVLLTVVATGSFFGSPSTQEMEVIISGSNQNSFYLGEFSTKDDDVLCIPSGPGDRLIINRTYSLSENNCFNV